MVVLFRGMGRRRVPAAASCGSSRRLMHHADKALASEDPQKVRQALRCWQDQNLSENKASTQSNHNMRRLSLGTSFVVSPVILCKCGRHRAPARRPGPDGKRGQGARSYILQPCVIQTCRRPDSDLPLAQIFLCRPYRFSCQSLHAGWLGTRCWAIFFVVQPASCMLRYCKDTYLRIPGWLP